MDVWTVLVAGGVVVTVLLAALVFESRRRLSVVVATLALVLLWLPVLALGAAGLLGRPKPARLEWLRAVPEAEVLASHIAEGEAIWLWLALPGRREPFALELPWDLRTARALVEARQRAQELGTGLLVRRPLRSSPDDREPMFHPLPQPPLPPKTVPSPAGPAAAAMPPER